MRVAHIGQHNYELDWVKLQEVGHNVIWELRSPTVSNLHCNVKRQQLKLCRCLELLKGILWWTMRRIFDGYVRPNLKYCVQVWSPYLKKDIECLEKVQRATKLEMGLKNKSYPERLTLLHMTLLTKRRTRGNLIQFFRILNGIHSVKKKHFSNWLMVAATVWGVTEWN